MQNHHFHLYQEHIKTSGLSKSYMLLLEPPVLMRSCLHHYWQTVVILIDAILQADDGLEREINELETSVSHLQIQNGKCSSDLEEGGHDHMIATIN